ncbi:WD40-repeat-containing domain protein [Massariosphaeria phaeospora]|uniref:WD40-repeat-containing domain protein n=1 Tax=Massariosphaeria phaeospora TaxID=100035 RepID=A0A7C8M616_9PLEO|nr:WD40-repeat-containing domain protein [Massariosphaeria phaeospora]
MQDASQEAIVDDQSHKSTAGSSHEPKEHSGEDESESDDSTGSKDDSSDFESMSSLEDDASSTRHFTQLHLNCIQNVQLTPDSSCILTSDSDNGLSVYAIDSDIMKATDTRRLQPYARLRKATPIWAFAVNHNFSIFAPDTTNVLVGCRDQYITLHHALWDASAKSNEYTEKVPASTKNATPIDISTRLASYKFVDSLTEAVYAPLSLAYNLDGTHFFAGGRNRIAVFDLQYCEKPVSYIKTIPAERNKRKGGGRGFKGEISALAVSSAARDTLAAGARTRHVGIYASGQEVTHWSLPGRIGIHKVPLGGHPGLVGDGITQLKWSPCGTYLYVAERMSDAILIYDVRKFEITLGYCAGRKALTKQKLGFDLWTGETIYGHETATQEVWAGGTDGKIRVWTNAYLSEGAIQPNDTVDVSHAPVSNTIVHASGTVAVASSGSYEVSGEGYGGSSMGGTRASKYIIERSCLDILGLASY